MRAYTRLFLIVNVFVALPLLFKIPFWSAGLYAVVMLWHELTLSGRLPALSRLVKLALVAAALVGLSIHFGNLLSVAVWMSFLVLFVGITLTTPTKDYQVFLNVVFNWFVLIGSALSGEGVLAFLHMAVSLLLVSSHLLALAGRFQTKPFATLKSTAWFYAQGLPIFFVIMILFPSLSEKAGAFWEISGGGRIGFSDQLSPGRILRLGSDDKVAFRVSFLKGLSPAPEDMYWRGAVLWDTDGINWFNEYDAPLSPESEVPPGAGDIVQRITLEPKKDPALFGLESPKSVTIIEPEFQNAVPLAHGQFAYFAEPNLRLVYEARSTIGPSWLDEQEATTTSTLPVPELSPSQRKAALTVPAEVGPVVRKLIKSWRDDARSDEDVVSQALIFFGTQGFSYTLDPGKPMRSVREFIFESKRGFCGHYASVFAVMMRLAGLPARVVVGYHGGTYNASANYWIVRQQHAHAWTEVWFENRGWVRVDPVAVVMPERISQGESLFNFAHQSAVSKAIEALRLFFDGLSYKWERYFQGDDEEAAVFASGSDASFLDAEMKRRLSLLFPLLILALILTRRRKLESNEVADEALRLYRKFCVKQDRHGIARQNHEGPLDYAQRLGAHYPQNAAEIQAMLELYARLRYGIATDSRAELKTLRRRLFGLSLSVPQTPTQKTASY